MDELIARLMLVNPEFPAETYRRRLDEGNVYWFLEACSFRRGALIGPRPPGVRVDREFTLPPDVLGARLSAELDEMGV